MHGMQVLKNSCLAGMFFGQREQLLNLRCPSVALWMRVVSSPCFLLGTQRFTHTLFLVGLFSPRASSCGCEPHASSASPCLWETHTMRNPASENWLPASYALDSAGEAACLTPVSQTQPSQASVGHWSSFPQAVGTYLSSSGGMAEAHFSKDSLLIFPLSPLT